MERKKRKIKVGWVVSNKMQKTVVVAIDRLLRHPRYNRVIKRTSKLYAHDGKNQCRIGDKILVMETRPFSKLKRWRVVEVLEKAK
jgi:small subunit ribosomal protein S17